MRSLRSSRLVLLAISGLGFAAPGRRPAHAGGARYFVSRDWRSSRTASARHGRESRSSASRRHRPAKAALRMSACRGGICLLPLSHLAYIEEKPHVCPAALSPLGVRPAVRPSENWTLFRFEQSSDFQKNLLPVVEAFLA